MLCVAYKKLKILFSFIIVECVFHAGVFEAAAQLLHLVDLLTRLATGGILGGLLLGALFLDLHHLLEHTTALDGSLVLVGVLKQFLVLRVLYNLELERNGLVEAHIRIIDEGNEEFVVAGAAHSLAHFDDLFIERLVLDVLNLGHSAFLALLTTEDDLGSEENLSFVLGGDDEPPSLSLEMRVAV